jgi:hypothetical protein
LLLSSLLLLLLAHLLLQDLLEPVLVLLLLCSSVRVAGNPWLSWLHGLLLLLVQPQRQGTWVSKALKETVLPRTEDPLQ